MVIAEGPSTTSAVMLQSGEARKKRSQGRSHAQVGADNNILCNMAATMHSKLYDNMGLSPTMCQKLKVQTSSVA